MKFIEYIDKRVGRIDESKKKKKKHGHRLLCPYCGVGVYVHHGVIHDDDDEGPHECSGTTGGVQNDGSASTSGVSGGTNGAGTGGSTGGGGGTAGGGSGGGTAGGSSGGGGGV